MKNEKYFVFYRVKTAMTIGILNTSSGNELQVHESETKEGCEDFLKLATRLHHDIIRIVKGIEIGFKITTDLDIENNE